ncbi:hypothetical protein [Paenibacillus nasutitermitis]|nr:hypothetical protein [Paenibacillus nasutitermitis]
MDLPLAFTAAHRSTKYIARWEAESGEMPSEPVGNTGEEGKSFFVKEA